MKKFLVIIAIIFSFCSGWSNSAFGKIFEASGHGKIPASIKTPAQAKILARRSAIVDLQRNLLIKARLGSTSGIIRGIVITNETWDGKIYSVTGYINRR